MPLGLIGFFWGALSAVSLPLGATLGLASKPGKLVTSSLMAFGAGALLFALTIELFGSTLHHAQELGEGLVVATMVGAVCGGLLFDLLNQMLNNRGAFLRGLSNTRRYVGLLKRNRLKAMMKELSKIELLQKLPAGEFAQLAPLIRRDVHKAGEELYHEGEPGTALYFIHKGRVAIRQAESGQLVTRFEVGPGFSFGEVAMLTHAPRSASAVVLEDATLYHITRHDFDHILEHSPALQTALAEIGQHRIHELAAAKAEVDHDWATSSHDAVDQMHIQVSDLEIHREVHDAEKKGGAFFAIWLGILLDGIPESLVIGMLAASGSGMSLAFIVGVFLANLPEAMSSSVGMRNAGMSKVKILTLWGSLTIMTGVGAAIGTYIFPPHPVGVMAYWVSGIEGLAAGAMLTMIAETMLPEAFEQGGSITGFSTLMGFLASLSIKLW